MPEQSVTDQIEAMLAIGEVKPEPEPTPEPDPVSDPEPEPEPVKDPPKDPEPEPEPVADPDPEPKPEPTDPPVDELKQIKEENERLRKQVEESLTPKEDPEPQKVEPEPEPEPIKDIEFLGDDADLEELTRDPKKLNALLNKVYVTGVESQRTYQESTLKSIPDIVKRSVSIQATLAKEVEKFYSSNEDLRSFKKVVATIYEELGSENPDWTIAKTFEEVEKETRNRLELRKEAIDPAPPEPEPEPDPVKGPKFAKVKGRQEKQKPRTDSLLNEIDEMNKDI